MDEETWPSHEGYVIVWNKDGQMYSTRFVYPKTDTELLEYQDITDWRWLDDDDFPQRWKNIDKQKKA